MYRIMIMLNYLICLAFIFFLFNNYFSFYYHCISSYLKKSNSTKGHLLKYSPPHPHLIKIYFTVLFVESKSLMLELLDWFFKFVTFSPSCWLFWLYPFDLKKNPHLFLWIFLLSVFWLSCILISKSSFLFSYSFLKNRILLFFFLGTITSLSEHFLF